MTVGNQLRGMYRVMMVNFVTNVMEKIWLNNSERVSSIRGEGEENMLKIGDRVKVFETGLVGIIVKIDFAGSCEVDLGTSRLWYCKSELELYDSF